MAVGRRSPATWSGTKARLLLGTMFGPLRDLKPRRPLAFTYALAASGKSPGYQYRQATWSNVEDSTTQRMWPGFAD
jgi:hypothetical protein